MSKIVIDTDDMEGLSQTQQNNLLIILNQIKAIKEGKKKIMSRAKHTDWNESRGIYMILLECGHVIEHYELTRTQTYECKECEAARRVPKQEEADAGNV